jgi:hypothetical protein
MRKNLCELCELSKIAERALRSHVAAVRPGILAYPKWVSAEFQNEMASA